MLKFESFSPTVIPAQPGTMYADPIHGEDGDVKELGLIPIIAWVIRPKIEWESKYGKGDDPDVSRIVDLIPVLITGDIPSDDPMIRCPDGRFHWFEGDGDEAAALEHIRYIDNRRKS